MLLKLIGLLLARDVHTVLPDRELF